MRRLVEMWRVAPWPMGAAAVAAVGVSLAIYAGNPLLAGINGILCGMQMGMAGIKIAMARHRADLEKWQASMDEFGGYHARVQAELTALQVVLKEMGVEVEIKSNVERTH